MSLCLALAACSAVPDFEEVETPPPDAALTARATPEELAQPRLLSRLLGQGTRAPAAPPSAPPGEAVADLETPEIKRGSAALDIAEAPASGPAADAAAVAPEALPTDSVASVSAVEAAPTLSEPGRRGLFSRNGNKPSEPEETIQVASALAAPAAPAAQRATEASSAGPRRGIFGDFLSGAPQRAPEEQSGVTQELAYGQVVSVCGTPRRDLGREVARYPEQGSGAYRLFDSNPSTVALRPHYITGFADGCPRKFLAALALFGGPQSYETTRTKDGRSETAITETDTRYKAIRAGVCGAPVGRACPSRRFDQLERRAVFVSVYQRFGTNPTWADMLIYDGEVVAKDFKTVR